MSDKNKKKNKNVKDPGPGQLLQQARIRKELSIEDISSRLRLAKDVIDALENDKYDKLPAPIFVRGYMKSYASFVGVDSNQVIDRYNQKVGEVDANISLGAAHVTPPSMTAIKDRKKKWLPVVAAGVLVLLGFVVWMFADTDTPEQVQLTDSAATVATATNTLDPTIEPGLNNQQTDEVLQQQVQVEATPAAPVPEPEVATEPKPTATVSANEPDTGGDEVNPEGAVKPELDQLVLVFNGDSWVDVSDATGKRLIYRMLKSGQQRSVAGQPPFKLTLGNAPEINLTRNGETVDLTPYTRGKVAKFRLGKINE